MKYEVIKLDQDLQKKLMFEPAPANMINLSTNENKFIHHDILKYKLKDFSPNLIVNNYGTSKHSSLRQSYARYLNIEESQILPAPGSESLIQVLLNGFVKNSLLTFQTDFFRYEEIALLQNKKHYTVNNNEGISGLIAKAKGVQPDLIILSNPNNPLGNIYEEKDLLFLLDEVQCYVVIDEAYAEYTNITLTKYLTQYPNLIILKTMSKAWGLASLRVGFVVANYSIIKYLDAIQGPFVLADLNGYIAEIVLNQKDQMLKSVEQTKIAREEFVKELENLGFESIKSHTNFVYIKSSDASEISNKLFHNNMVVASRNDGLRITIGQKNDMNKLINILKQIKPEQT